MRADLTATLPEPVRAAVDWRQDEPAWRRADIPALAQAAEEAGLACIGGQVQLRLPGVTAELYWCDYDPAPRRQAEPWSEYSSRSWREIVFLVDALPTDEALIEGARKTLPELSDSEPSQFADAVWFVVYLAVPES